MLYRKSARSCKKAMKSIVSGILLKDSNYHAAENFPLKSLGDKIENNVLNISV